MNKDNPQVSLGMPLYNAERYLEDTLRSLLNQSFSDFEIIISDNASNDKTPFICTNYASLDDRIHYYRNDKNLGAANNFNKIVELASGQYFKWVAYDDPIDTEYLSRCVPILDNKPDVILCYPRTILIDGKGSVLEHHLDGFHLMSSKPHERFRNYFQSSAWCHPVFGLFRVENLRKTNLIGGYPSSDRVLLGQVALAGKCFEIPEHLAYRRIHPNNSTNINKTDEEMYLWFDPSNSGYCIPPRYKRFIELLWVINRASVQAYERFYCYLEFFRFYFSPLRFGGIRKDIMYYFRNMNKLY